MKKLFCVICWFLSVGTILYIFSLSNKNSSQSGGIVLEVVENTIGKINEGKTLNNLYDKYSFQNVIHFCRKTLHVLEYLWLSFVTYLAFYNTFKSRYYLSLFVVVSVAVVDEFLVQANTIGRYPTIKDVCIDSIGTVLGFLFSKLIVILYRKIKG